jgi:hypothetical protein
LPMVKPPFFCGEQPQPSEFNKNGQSSQELRRMDYPPLLLAESP